MTHLGLSGLVEIPSNSHFTMQNGSLLDKGVTVRAHLGEKGNTPPDIQGYRKAKPKNTCFVFF